MLRMGSVILVGHEERVLRVQRVSSVGVTDRRTSFTTVTLCCNLVV